MRATVQENIVDIPFSHASGLPVSFEFHWTFLPNQFQTLNFDGLKQFSVFIELMSPWQ